MNMERPFFVLLSVILTSVCFGFGVFYQWTEFNVSSTKLFPKYLTAKEFEMFGKRMEDILRPNVELTEGRIGVMESSKDLDVRARESEDARDEYVGPGNDTQFVNKVEKLGPNLSGNDTQSVTEIKNVGPIKTGNDTKSVTEIKNNGPIQAGNDTQVIEVQKVSDEVEPNEFMKVKSAEYNQLIGGQSTHKQQTKHGSCCPRIMMKNAPHAEFQKVSNISYVYSAYFDGRPESGQPTVRVIGVVALNSMMYCHLWFKGDTRPVIVQAELMIIKHFSPVTYENAVINCPLNESEETKFRVPSRLVLSSSKCGPPDAILDVIDNSALSPEVNFTVCLHKAFILNYNNSNEFVEWIEMNRILGAQRFLIYNFTGGSALTPYLQHYVDEGLVELHDWNVDKFRHAIPWYMGQGALINDCIYRSMYTTKFLMLIDVDEVMVPQKADTWAEALEDERNCQGSDSMLVRNAFFLKNYENSSDTAQDESDIEFLRLTHRLNFTHPCPKRTKIIMRPLKARQAGVHITMQQSDGSAGENCCLSPDDLVLQHYRDWTKSMKETWDDELQRSVKYEPGWEKIIQHPRMEHFKTELVQNVNKIKQIASS